MTMSETVSENTKPSTNPSATPLKPETVSKKKRGRPPVMDSRRISVFKGIYPDITTNRSHQNHLYQGLAQQVLTKDGKLIAEKYSWFCGDKLSYRQGVLVELGRLECERGAAFVLAAADSVTEAFDAGEVKTTREAVAWVKNLRLNLKGKMPRPSAEALAFRMWQAAVEYHGQYPELSPDDVKYAVDVLRAAAETILSDTGEDNWREPMPPLRALKSFAARLIVCP